MHEISKRSYSVGAYTGGMLVIVQPLIACTLHLTTTKDSSISGIPICTLVGWYLL